MLRRTLAIPILFLAASLGLAQNKPNIKSVPAGQSDPTSGKGMFVSYCAACHGKDAKGAGPAAQALRKTPTDLTILARKNSGKFPAVAVKNIIMGDPLASAAHGSKEMPVWGDIFRSLSSNESISKMRIHNLVSYIESLQSK
ncbi:MAG: cytochrome c [Bryobacterales bacterium]|nr:cytochrome c [Bryobacterales bacterium]